jgi:hypothetical protein
MSYTYTPPKVSYTEKPNGDIRTVFTIPKQDYKRIKDCINRPLTAYCEIIFHPHSYAYNPKKSLFLAIQQLKNWGDEGCHWLISIDLANHFNNVPHNLLLYYAKFYGLPESLLKEITARIQTPFIQESELYPHTKGVYPGSPESGLLANLHLTPLDHYLSNHGIKYLRYGDNLFIACLTEADAKVQGDLAIKGIQTYAKIPVGKYSINPLSQNTALGYQFVAWNGQYYLVPSAKTLEKLLVKLKNHISDLEIHQSAKKCHGKIQQTLAGSFRFYCLTSYPSYTDSIRREVFKYLVHLINQCKIPRKTKINLLSKLVGCKSSGVKLENFTNSQTLAESLAGQSNLPSIPPGP